MRGRSGGIKVIFSVRNVDARSLNFENTVDAAEFLSVLLKYTSQLFKVLFCIAAKAFFSVNSE